MKLILCFTIFYVLAIPAMVFGASLDASTKKLNAPPRIIRTCCSFGADIGVVGIPFYRLTESTSIEKLGEHCYLGNKNEGNGILYTQRGGFIDIGHLRDQADWTAYLHRLISLNKGNEINLKLGKEGGDKRLIVQVPVDMDNTDAILLAGRITYDLSVWHELATWFGVSSVPFVPERYSAFSIEDDYSNLLGISLGMKALGSELPFEQAMTQLVQQTLDSLGVVATEQETIDAMEMVRNQWWSGEYRYPSRKILIERDVTPYTCYKPMLVPQLSHGVEPHELSLPVVDNNQRPLTDFYTLILRLNHKFPVKNMFPDRKNRIITQDDFYVLIQRAIFEIGNYRIKDEQRKLRRNRSVKDNPVQ
jgi:hypothetical protein